MSFRELTPGQIEELRDILAGFVSDRIHDGLDCVVLIRGRGQERLAYSSEYTPHSTVLDMAETAVNTMRLRIARTKN